MFELSQYAKLSAIRLQLAKALYERHRNVDIQVAVKELSQFVFKFIGVTFETPKMVEAETETFPTNAKPEVIVETVMRLIEERLTEEERRPATAADEVKRALTKEYPKIKWVTYSKVYTNEQGNWISVYWKQQGEDKALAVTFLYATDVTEMVQRVLREVAVEMYDARPAEVRWQERLQSIVDTTYPNDKYQVTVENSLIKYFFATVKIDKHTEAKMSYRHDDHAECVVDDFIALIARTLENNKK